MAGLYFVIWVRIFPIEKCIALFGFAGFMSLMAMAGQCDRVWRLTCKVCSALLQGCGWGMFFWEIAVKIPFLRMFQESMA